MELKDKIDWLLRYYSLNPSHSLMYDERVEKSENFNVELGIDNYIIKKINTAKIVLLTGDAGDGKTRIIYNLRKILPQITNKEIVYFEDFSQLEKSQQKELFDDIDETIKNNCKKLYIIAANSGIFASSMIKYKVNLLDNINNKGEFIEINFNKRNLARKHSNEVIKETLFYHIVVKFLNGTDRCNCKCECINGAGFCPFEYNLRYLRNESVIDSLRELFHSLFLTGIHVTFRELLSSLSYFVTGGYSCKELQEYIESGNDILSILFFNNVFNFSERVKNVNYNPNDRVLLKLSEIDVSKKDFRDIDYLIYSKKFDYSKIDMKEIQFIMEDKLNSLGGTRNKKNRKTRKQQNLEFMKMIKRYLFFVNPEALLNGDELIAAIPIDFLMEFNELLEILSDLHVDEISNFDSNLPKVVSNFELGMNRLSSYNSTSSMFEVYDAPPMVGRNIRLKYNIDEDDIELVYSVKNEDIDEDKEKLLNYDYNLFQIEAFSDNNRLSTLNVDYELFSQIFMAKDKVYKPYNSDISSNPRLDSFRNEMVQNIDIKKSIIITWANSEQNFKIGLIRNQRKGTIHISINL